MCIVCVQRMCSVCDLLYITGELGALEFSLQYDPIEEMLNVMIIQAQGLKSMDVGGTSDPYVKCNIIPGVAKVSSYNCLKLPNNKLIFKRYNYQNIITHIIQHNHPHHPPGPTWGPRPKYLLYIPYYIIRYFPGNQAKDRCKGM